MKPIAFAVLAFAAGSGAASAADFETRPGGEVRTVNRSFFDAQCRVNGYAAYAVVTQPGQGTVEIRRTPITLKIAVDHPHCVGKTVEGVAVFYKPKPGFKGVDRFTVSRARDRASPEFTDVVVTVK